MTAGRSGAPASVAVAPDNSVRGEQVAVRQVLERWRVDDAWWREEPVCRMYYELELEGGQVTVLFHDRTLDRWYQQRYGR